MHAAARSSSPPRTAFAGSLRLELRPSRERIFHVLLSFLSKIPKRAAIVVRICRGIRTRDNQIGSRERTVRRDVSFIEAVAALKEEKKKMHNSHIS